LNQLNTIDANDIDNADFVIQQISNSLRDGIRPDVSMFINIELLQEDSKHFVKLMKSLQAYFTE